MCEARVCLGLTARRHLRQGCIFMLILPCLFPGGPAPWSSLIELLLLCEPFWGRKALEGWLGLGSNQGGDGRAAVTPLSSASMGQEITWPATVAVGGSHVGSFLYCLLTGSVAPRCDCAPAHGPVCIFWGRWQPLVLPPARLSQGQPAAQLAKLLGGRGSPLEPLSQHCPSPSSSLISNQEGKARS